MPVFLFSDIEGSTQKWESFREAMAKALAQHDEIMLATLKRFGGKIIKHTGDGVFAMFENRLALQCALALQEEIGKADWNPVKGLKVRLALHAGDAEKRGEDYFGPTINRTARVLATGWGGQIVLTPLALAACDLPEGGATEPLGTHLLKDLSDPQPLLGLIHAAHPEKFPPLRSLSSKPNNLPPQSTAFFGREEELKKIASDFKDPACHMVTLVGQGGMGKTRLALQAAAERLDDFSDGVYFIPLAALTNLDGMVSALAGAVGFFFSGEKEMSQQLLRYFKDRSMFLVLDNFEHLLTSASLVGEILNTAPKIKILVTSRSRLNLVEEWVTDLEGMSYPKNGANEPLENFAAVKFFLTCARRTQLNFTLGESQGGEVAKICRIMDGIPLGLELAAAWVRTLSCQEIREEIEKNLDFLASKRQGVPERHQSLRAVFEYSWSLLSDKEKRALRALSVFRGGFLREQAEKVAGCPTMMLSELLDKSLLRKSPANRFEMHEMIRQFSWEKLKEVPEEYLAVRAKHSRYFCEFLATREKSLKGRNEDSLLKEIGAEISNLRAAWEWAVESEDIPFLQQACDAFFQFLEIKFMAKDGEELFGLGAAKFAEPGRDRPEQKLVLSKMLARQGWFIYQQGRMEKAGMLLKQALELTTALQQPKETGQCLHFLCGLYTFQRKFTEQEDCAKKSLGIFKGLNDDFGIAWSLYHLAQKPKQDHDNELAWKYLMESLELFRKMEYDDGMAWNFKSLGQIALLRRNFAAAKEYFNESVAIFNRHDNKVSTGMTLLELAHLSEDQEDYEAAFTLAQQAYQTFQASSHRHGLAWAQLYCTDAAFNMGKWEDSLSAARVALRLFSEEEDQVGQGWTYANLCRATNQGRQFEESRVYGKKGIETFQRLNDKEGIGACQYFLAYCELGSGNFAEAEKLFLSALENGLARNIRWRVLDALLGLGDLRARTGKPSEGYLYASFVLGDPESPKDLKAKASKVISGLKSQVNEMEAIVIEEEARSLKLETLAAQLLTKPR